MGERGQQLCDVDELCVVSSATPPPAPSPHPPRRGSLCLGPALAPPPQRTGSPTLPAPLSRPWEPTEEERKELLEALGERQSWASDFAFQPPAGSCLPENLGPEGSHFGFGKGQRRNTRI